jgi:hypothetical protein
MPRPRGGNREVLRPRLSIRPRGYDALGEVQMNNTLLYLLLLPIATLAPACGGSKEPANDADKAAQEADEAAQKASDEADKAKDKADEELDKAKDKADETKDKANETEDKPKE